MAVFQILRFLNKNLEESGKDNSSRVFLMKLLVIRHTYKNITAQDQTIIRAFVAIFSNFIGKNSLENKDSIFDKIQNVQRTHFL